MSDIKQLLEKATRKTEMKWRVFAFDPEQDNKLVHTSKDAFDCIKMAGEYKMDLAKKNPNYIIEIIAESKEKKKVAQKNEAKEYKLYKLKKIGNDKALVGTYPATSMGDALQKRINMRKKNDGFIWEVVEIENGKGKVIDSTEHYTDEFIKNNFKGDHYRNKESAQKNESVRIKTTFGSGKRSVDASYAKAADAVDVVKRTITDTTDKGTKMTITVESYTIQNINSLKEATIKVKEICKPANLDIAEKLGLFYDGKANIAQYLPNAKQLVIFKESAQKNEEKEFTIKLVTPFGKAKVCSWKANSVDAAVKEFLDANPAYRENKKGAVIAESAQKNEALNLDSLTDEDAKQLIQYLQDFIKDKSSKYYHIDKIEAILKKKYKAESLGDEIVQEVKEEVKDGVKDLIQQDVDAKLNGEITSKEYQANFEDVDDDSDGIFGDELDNAEPDEPEQTNEYTRTNEGYDAAEVYKIINSKYGEDAWEKIAQDADMMLPHQKNAFINKHKNKIPVDLLQAIVRHYEIFG